MGLVCVTHLGGLSALLNSEEFEACFREWAQALEELGACHELCTM